MDKDKTQYPVLMCFRTSDDIYDRVKHICEKEKKTQENVLDEAVRAFIHQYESRINDLP